MAIKPQQYVARVTHKPIVIYIKVHTVASQ